MISAIKAMQSGKAGGMDRVTADSIAPGLLQTIFSRILRYHQVIGRPV